MRHRKTGRRLGRTSSHRDAMLRNMVTSLLDQERIVTTVAKAKEARIVTEQMITLGKKGDLHARRQAMSYIRSKSVVAKLFDQLSGQYAERNGGYTRIIRTGARLGDAAPMAILELVEYKEAVREVKAEQEQ